jgi:hypothetical protein
MKKHYKILLAFFMLSTHLLSAQRDGKMLFTARLTGANEKPTAVITKAKGLVTAVVEGNTVTINAVFDSLSGPVTNCHFHKANVNSTGATFTNFLANVRGNRLYVKTTLTNAQITDMIEGNVYLNVHTAANTGGEIRGQMDLQSDYLYTAVATGANETPAVSTPATGIGSFIISKTLYKVDYKFVANGLTGPITMAHLHYGAVGKNGAVAFPLTVNGNVLSGTITTSRAFEDSLANEKVYINIHTAANPNGEIRGQVYYQGAGIGFDGLLEGAQEVPAVTSNAKGAMFAIIRSTLDTLDYAIQLNGITPTLAHFHKGVAGTNGGALVNLTPAVASFPSVYSGYLALTPAMISALVRDSFYANFHTRDNPNGEIRGQVLSVLRTSLVSNLCGGQETPAVTTTASGAGYMSLSRDKTDVFLEAVTNGLSTNASSAHVHRGEKGVAGPVSIGLTTAIVGNAISGALNLASFQPLADSIARGLTYFNFHTTANPNGEIRGQAAADLVQECLANSTLELNGEKFAVKLAPNPASSFVNISFNSNEELNVQIVISDIAGRQIATQKAQILRGSNNIDINVANWNNGIYFIQMRQANRLLFTEKVVKN